MTNTTATLMRVRRYLLDQEAAFDHQGDEAPGGSDLQSTYWEDAREYNIATRLIDSLLDDEGWPTYHDVLDIQRTFADSSDPSGSAMVFLFAIADCLREHEHDNGDSSRMIWDAFSRWKFRPGAGEPITRYNQATGEGAEAEEIRDMPTEALIKAGDILSRYIDWLEQPCADRCGGVVT